MNTENCKMFCYQCEELAGGKGCTSVGVCGKQSNVACLQDLLIYSLKGLAHVGSLADAEQINTKQASKLICEGLFSTITNVNFDAARVALLIKNVVKERDNLRRQLKSKTVLHDASTFQPKEDLEGLCSQGQEHKILDKNETNEDIQSLKNTLLYGIKGVAAYAHHAMILGKEDEKIHHFFKKALALMLDYETPQETWINLLMECGQINLRCMELLDEGNTSFYGQPTPTRVPLGSKKGKAILMSGHDLKDLEMLLEQTKGKGINVYTHGEMLPTHAYPKLKQHPHFFGHYGTAWQNQKKEFSAFPGSIIMTTNCIQAPQDSYKDHLFTTGLVAWPNIKHIDARKDFSPAIKMALELPGFDQDTDKGFVTVGFGHGTILSVADKVVQLVKEGKIRHFFLVGGCDASKPGRNYYTEFVEKIPADCVILTLACGKFRFFDKNLGEIDGLPRLLDVGQCNDAYSAIKIAVALAKAFNCNVNDLPLSLVLSWYEQKAVAILLTLFALGIKNIRLGPTLPGFISPNVRNYLIEQFSLKTITTPEDDLKAILEK